MGDRIEQKIGELFFIGIPGPVLDDPTRKLLERIQPGGICLFARNIREREQTRRLLDDLRKQLSPQTLFSVDQEGGLVDRLRRVMTPMPSADKLRSVTDATELGSIVAETLRIFGFNMNFAPVVDVMDARRGKLSNGLHSRIFGNSREEATELGRAFLKAMHQGGIHGCLKHFPGLGAAAVDSHRELPCVSIHEHEFRETDLYPYRTLLASGEASSVMIAHATFPNVGLQERGQNGKLLPSSLSPAIISELLRDELRYDGLVLTDDLEMGAIVENYGIGDACTMAIAAGADMLAICASEDAINKGFEAVSRAVDTGEIAETRLQRSLTRIASLKEKVHEPLEFDNARLDALSERIAELNARLK
jgi:beta-N-acetylhexosaminidase